MYDEEDDIEVDEEILKAFMVTPEEAEKVKKMQEGPVVDHSARKPGWVESKDKPAWVREDDEVLKPISKKKAK
ncbi:MAG: hypothetical protein J7L88_06520 [Thermoplasmata archaeon]|nr:hypothetical protein [Thermoplasmata archaeon]